MSDAVLRQHRIALSPLHYRLPVVDIHQIQRRRSPAGVVVGVLMFVLAGWLVVQNDMFRSFEARMVTPVAALVIGGPAVRVNDIVYFGLGTQRRFGLQLTDECTSALLLIPLLVMMAFFAIFTRLSLRRQLLAVFSGAVLILAVNLGRMVTIAYSTWEWGFNPGYEYSHVFVGSAASLVGFVGAVLLALWILVRGDRLTIAAAAASSSAAAPAEHPTLEAAGTPRATDPRLDRAELLRRRAELERALADMERSLAEAEQRLAPTRER